MINFRARECIFFLIIGVLLSSCATVPTGPVAGVPEPVSETPTADKYGTVMQAYYLSFNGEVDAARALFEKLMRQFPDDRDLLYQYARFNIDLAYRVQDKEMEATHLTLAKQNLQRILEVEPDYMKARELLADISIERGEFEEAVGNLEYIASRQPENSQAILALSRLYVHLGNPEEAITLLEPYLDVEVLDNYEYLKVYALACGEAQQLFEAIEAYRRYLDKFPMEFEASYNLALCYFKTTQYHSAETVLQQMRESEMMTPEVAQLLTDVFRAQERYSEAIALLEQMAANPRLEVNANIEIGQIYLGLEMFEDAYRYLLKAVSKDPNNRRATFYTA
ncbi:MAG TPA: tetratricopeptide repeat protein, partial [bacterium]|nr:tetratricopeptide repeat protein [bacterium]